MEILLTAIKLILPLIKYVINTFELFTYSNFEHKNTFFSILDFIFTTVKLVIRLLIMNYVRINFGLPLHLIGDAIEDVVRIV